MAPLPLGAVHVSLSRAIPLSLPFLGGSPRHRYTASVPTPDTPFGVLAVQGLFTLLPPEGGRRYRASRVPVESVYSMPGSSTPGMPRPARHSAWRSVAFRVYELVGHSHCAFRGSITFRPAASLSTLNRDGLLRSIHDSLLAAWFSLTGGVSTHSILRPCPVASGDAVMR